MHICDLIYFSDDEQPSQLTVAANKARAEDLASLKGKILEYILPDPNTNTLEPALTRTHGKSSCGFNTLLLHIICAQSIGQINTRIISSKYLWRSLCGDYSQNYF